MTTFAWQLPKGLDELLPEQARQLEQHRQALLWLTDSWGYDYVIPPFAEFMDVLSVGIGQDIASEIFQVADNHSDKMLGIRADMTPQVARIDAHKLYHQGINRFCYLGTVLLARGSADGLGSRSPFQFGAELYGESSNAADIAIIELLLASMATVEVPIALLDFGHVGIFHHITQQAELNRSQTRQLYEILQGKSASDLENWTQHNKISTDISQLLIKLLGFYGEAGEVLNRAEIELVPLLPSMDGMIKNLRAIIQSIKINHPTVECQIDFAEHKGYRYHTGVVFAAYTHDHGAEIARGGRYDKIGEAFGRARPATGFSADLKTLMRLSKAQAPAKESVFIPYTKDTADNEKVEKIIELRAQGHRVIQGLQADETAQNNNCQHILEKQQSGWQIRPASS
jgi:ATP phosphoribosyltransferase regulatory subunit